MKVGITGHQELDDPTWVKDEILRVLRKQEYPLIGVSSLALGADQLFAQAILDCSGSLEVIIPFEGYIETFDTLERSEYERLLKEASSIEVLSTCSTDEEAYLAAGIKVVNSVDLLIAVWDGNPAAGLGGTGDVVEYAVHQGKRYVHINPITKSVAFPIER
jgi:hypothetical protein